MTNPIPCPPSLPFLGHVTHIEKEVPLRSFMLLAHQYGEIYQMHQFCEYKLSLEIVRDTLTISYSPSQALACH